MNRLKRFIRCICFFVVAALIFAGLTHIFERKTLFGAWNYTTKVNGYLNSEPNTIDVVCFGSSHMYCSVNPVVLEKQQGISAYVLATQQQPIKASYYYMLEALKTQSPKVFIFETFMVNRSEQIIPDSIIADAVDPLPWSMNKVRMVADLTEGKESKIPYFFTLFRYGSRWKELHTEDFSFNRKNLTDEHKGYAYLTEATPETKPFYDQPPIIDKIDSEDLEYLEKIVDLCRENNITLILLYAPYAMDEKGYNACFTMEQFAQDHGLDFINGYDLLSVIDFDFDKDFYDSGHLNYSGSYKLSGYIGDYLVQGGYLQ